MRDFARRRQSMVEDQIAGRGIRDLGVLAAMARVPREAFVNAGFEASAYEDGPLPIGESQTISQPYIVALMVEAAGLAPGDRVLEVGTGSGYAAAVMAEIAGRVFTVERHGALGEAARARLARLGYANVEVRTGDGSIGWPECAPFDAILVAAGGPAPPQALKDQLAAGGRLVIPVGSESEQRLIKLTRANDTEFITDDLGAVRFVPLVGEQGWAEGRRGGWW
jgi:protein-L-isoaspartate(D-aspartate) O-methyltransferase